MGGPGEDPSWLSHSYCLLSPALGAIRKSGGTQGGRWAGRYVQNRQKDRQAGRHTDGWMDRGRHSGSLQTGQWERGTLSLGVPSYHDGLGMFGVQLGDGPAETLGLGGAGARSGHGGSEMGASAACGHFL